MLNRLILAWFFDFTKRGKFNVLGGSLPKQKQDDGLGWMDQEEFSPLSWATTEKAPLKSEVSVGGFSGRKEFSLMILKPW